MSLHYISAERQSELKGDIVSRLGEVSIDGLLDLIAQVASDLGEGTFGYSDPLSPCPCWLSIAATIEKCRADVERTSAEYDLPFPGGSNDLGGE